MQLRKALAPRCSVDDQALQLIRTIAIIKCNKISETAKSRRRIMGDDRVLLNKILPLAMGEQRAIEQVHADLCGLPLERITVAESPNVSSGKFLHGITRTVIVDEIGRSGKVSKACYDIGEYDIYLHQHIFNGSPIGAGMHFVPRRAPFEHARHWHHTGITGSSKFVPGDILTTSPSTCMNTYGAIFQDLVRSLAFAEFFRVTHNFLSHYYSGSPLCHPSSNIVKELQ